MTVYEYAKLEFSKILQEYNLDQYYDLTLFVDDSYVFVKFDGPKKEHRSDFTDDYDSYAICCGVNVEYTNRSYDLQAAINSLKWHCMLEQKTKKYKSWLVKENLKRMLECQQ